MKKPSGYVSAIDVMKLPVAEREKLLTEAARLAKEEYENDRDLTNFEAFGDADLYGEFND